MEILTNCSVFLAIACDSLDQAAALTEVANLEDQNIAKRTFSRGLKNMYVRVC